LCDAAGVNYPGGKNGCGTWQKIINLMPPHEVYIEPFLGSGAVMRRKRPARLNVGIDLDPEAVRAVSAAIDFSDDERSHQDWKNGILEPIGRLDDFNDAAGTMATIDGLDDGGPWFRLVVGDAFNFFRSFVPTGKELLYLDPPYLMETRSSGPIYRHELTELDHGRLLDLIRGFHCMVLLSGYWSRLYADALKGWNSIHFPAMTRGGTLAVEWLWFNYPPPVELHDYRVLGNNFREREKLNRRIRRWRARLDRMEDLERQALLSAINDLPGPHRLA
jgi:hypothetical protein